MKSGEADCQTGEERKCVDSEGEQQAAEETEAEDTEDDTNDSHGGCSVAKVERLRLHHHRGATSL
jgi:hypothetical protein